MIGRYLYWELLEDPFKPEPVFYSYFSILINRYLIKLYFRTKIYLSYFSVYSYVFWFWILNPLTRSSTSLRMPGIYLFIYSSISNSISNLDLFIFVMYLRLGGRLSSASFSIGSQPAWKPERLIQFPDSNLKSDCGRQSPIGRQRKRLEWKIGKPESSAYALVRIYPYLWTTKHLFVLMLCLQFVLDVW